MNKKLSLLIFIYVFIIAAVFSQENTYISEEHSEPDAWRKSFSNALVFLKADTGDITLYFNEDIPHLLPTVKKILKSPLFSVSYLRDISILGEDSTLMQIFNFFSSEFVKDNDNIELLTDKVKIDEVLIFSNEILKKYEPDNIETFYILAADLLKEDDILEDLNPYEEFVLSEIREDSFNMLIEILSNYDLQPLILAASLLLEVNDLNFSGYDSLPCPYAEGQIIKWTKTPYGPIILGDSCDNIYHLKRGFIIDPAGNDEYFIEENICEILYIIDNSGDDIYRSKGDFGVAGNFMGISILIDSSGDDSYYGNYISNGASILGIGILADYSGNDLYSGKIASSGSAAFGIGILYDKKGNDVYISYANSQGMAGTTGIGILIDSEGNDMYSCTGLYTDKLRFSERYLSFGQGFSIGLRPDLPGGIGILSDGTGNDTYIADVFSQGAAYWYSFGGIFDGGGNDIYIASQYVQASGIHIAVGTILDEDGNDTYRSKSVSQGCGHDISAGILIDEGGKDVYIAEDLAQGAGNANSWSILIDAAGPDKYIVENFSNSRGWSDERRGYRGSSIFLDLRGKDYYIGPGEDNSVIFRSTYGVFLDTEDSLQRGD